MMWLPLKMMLVISNFLLIFLLFVLFADHVLSENNIKSWSTLFHILCFCWLCLRGAFWCITITAVGKWEIFTLYLLYWVPSPIEFGSFMLLPLFFAQVLYPREWKMYWGFVCLVYFCVILGLTMFMLIWAILRESFDLSYNEYSSTPLRAISGICFIFLALVQAAYGLKMAYERKWQHLRFLVSSPRSLMIFNSLLVLSFLSRGIYQIASIFHAINLPPLPLTGMQDISLVPFLLFEFWDYIPLALIMVTVTSRSLGSGRRSTTSTGERVMSYFKTNWLNYRSVPVTTQDSESPPNITPLGSPSLLHQYHLKSVVTTSSTSQPTGREVGSGSSILNGWLGGSSNNNNTKATNLQSKQNGDDHKSYGSINSDISKGGGHHRTNSNSGRDRLANKQQKQQDLIDDDYNPESFRLRGAPKSWLYDFGNPLDNPNNYWTGDTRTNHANGYSSSPKSVEFPKYRQQIQLPEHGITESEFMKSLEIAQAIDRQRRLEEREKKKALEEESEKQNPTKKEVRVAYPPYQPGQDHHQHQHQLPKKPNPRPVPPPLTEQQIAQQKYQLQQQEYLLQQYPSYPNDQYVYVGSPLKLNNAAPGGSNNTSSSHQATKKGNNGNSTLVGGDLKVNVELDLRKQTNRNHAAPAFRNPSTYSQYFSHTSSTTTTITTSPIVVDPSPTSFTPPTINSPNVSGKSSMVATPAVLYSNSVAVPVRSNNNNNIPLTTTSHQSTLSKSLSSSFANRSQLSQQMMETIPPPHPTQTSTTTNQSQGQTHSNNYMREVLNEEGVVDRHNGAGSADSINEEFEVGTYRPSSFIMKNIHMADRISAKAAKIESGSAEEQQDEEKDELFHKSLSQATDPFDLQTRSTIKTDEFYL